MEFQVVTKKPVEAVEWLQEKGLKVSELALGSKKIPNTLKVEATASYDVASAREIVHNAPGVQSCVWMS
jgi:hypothetical protein